MKKTNLITCLLVLVSSTMMAQWTAVNNGLPGLTTNGVANVRDSLFTAVNGHGVYFSIDNGESWAEWKNNSKLTTKKINDFEGLTAFSGTGGGNHFSVSGQQMLGIYQSISGEGGLTASRLSFIPVPAEQINDWIDEENPEIFYLATNNGVYYSPDKMNWTKSGGLTGDALVVNTLHLVEHDDDTETLYAGTNDGMYKSVDSGKTFSKSLNGIASGQRVNNHSFFVTTENGVYTFNEENDLFNPFIPSGDYYTSVVDLSKFVAYAFGDGVAKKINMMTGIIEDVSLDNVTGGAIIGATYVKDYLFVCTEQGGVFRMPLTDNLGVGDYEINHISFDVVPNPSTGSFTITSEEPVEVLLFNAQGSLLKAYDVKNSFFVQQSLSKGVYFVNQKGTRNTKKLIIE
ncbi:MAG: T9SS type A sorting domain-containing protein [Flavobacteriales bacterium]|nr:T9SS type A sorting domain-containing protein [Flavobacteriales bacterium]